MWLQMTGAPLTADKLCQTTCSPPLPHGPRIRGRGTQQQGARPPMAGPGARRGRQQQGHCLHPHGAEQGTEPAAGGLPPSTGSPLGNRPRGRGGSAPRYLCRPGRRRAPGGPRAAPWRQRAAGSPSRPGTAPGPSRARTAAAWCARARRGTEGRPRGGAEPRPSGKEREAKR